jgi:hypothetical protein
VVLLAQEGEVKEFKKKQIKSNVRVQNFSTSVIPGTQMFSKHVILELSLIHRN